MQPPKAGRCRPSRSWTQPALREHRRHLPSGVEVLFTGLVLLPPRELKVIFQVVERSGLSCCFFPECEERARTTSAEQLLPAQQQGKGGGKGVFPLPSRLVAACERTDFVSTGEKKKPHPGKRKESRGTTEGAAQGPRAPGPPGHCRHHTMYSKVFKCSLIFG